MGLSRTFVCGLGLGAFFLALPATRPAAAPPASAIKAPALSAEVRKQYQAALKRGRQLEEKRDWPGAIAAFGECLKLLPDDPWALSEQGWAAYNAKQLELAEKSTRAAIAAATQDDVKGASYYNLGLILEGRGDKAGAIAAYVASVKARGSAAVRSRLQTLDANAAAALEPLAPQTMSGPSRDLKSFCADWVAAANQQEDQERPRPCSCNPEAQKLNVEIEGEATVDQAAVFRKNPPYLDVRVIAAGCDLRQDNPRGQYYVQTHLALKTAAGWFVEKLVESESNHYCQNTLRITQLAVSDVIPGGSPEVSVRWSERGGCRLSSTRPSTWEHDFLSIAGIGPSKAPSLTRPIKVLDSEEELPGLDSGPDYKPKVYVDMKLNVQFSKDGTLTLSGKTHGIDRATAAELLGVHTLRFP